MAEGAGKRCSECEQLHSEERATCSWLLAFSRCFVSSVLDDVYALGKAYMRSSTFLRSFPKVAFEIVPRANVGLVVDDLSRPFNEDRRALPLPTPLSSRRSMA